MIALVVVAAAFGLALVIREVWRTRRLRKLEQEHDKAVALCRTLSGQVTRFGPLRAVRGGRR